MHTHDLCAALIQHSIIKSATWHNNLLLLTCDGETSKGLVYTWGASTMQPGMLQAHSVGGVTFVVAAGNGQGEQNGQGTPRTHDDDATATGLEDTFQNVRIRDLA